MINSNTNAKQLLVWIVKTPMIIVLYDAGTEEEGVAAGPGVLAEATDMVEGTGAVKNPRWSCHTITQ